MLLRTREIQFWQRQRGILTEGYSFVTQVPKLVKKTPIFFRKVFFSKCSHGNLESSFGNPAEIFPTKPISSRLLSKQDKKQDIFKKMLAVPRDFNVSVLTTPPEKFQPLAEKFQLKIRKR